MAIQLGRRVGRHTVGCATIWTNIARAGCQDAYRKICRRYNGSHPRCRPALRASLDTSQAHPTNNSNHNQSTTRLDGSSLPNPDEILQRRIFTLKYIPKSSQRAWAQCVARAAATVVWRNDAEAWAEWLMLPKCVLAVPNSKGNHMKTQTAALVRRRAERWLAGERMSLWHEAVQSCTAQHRRSSRATTKNARQERAINLTREGLMSKACSALTGTPPL
eukprot:7601288-Karenia_brevis.AAC.1